MRAKRSLGQHFLIDPNLQRKIVDALDPSADEVVVEIGPGTGALTTHLARRCRRLVAVELDETLAARLDSELEDETVDVVRADALETDLAALADAPAWAVVGNIPYNITTPLLFHLLEQRPRPERIIVMIQREVAERVVADPGSKTYGALSVGVQAVADAELLFGVGRRAFRPVPDVDSAVLRVVPRRPGLDGRSESDLRTLTRVAFGWRRKQLQKTLRAAPEYRLSRDEVAALETETGLSLVARPEALAPEALLRLARALRARGRPAGPDAEPREEALP